MPTHSDRSSGCARRQRRRPDFTHPPFVADEIHYLSSHPHFSWFCESAFLVDGYEPVSLLGTPALALRAHIPDRLANLELVNSIEDLDHIGVFHFIRQVRISGAVRAFSGEGDSGALVVDKATSQAVGLLFAVNTAGDSLACPIKSVLERLRAELVV